MILHVAGIGDQRLHGVATRQADEHLRGRAEVDEPLDRGGDAVLPASAGSMPTRSGRIVSCTGSVASRARARRGAESHRAGLARRPRRRCHQVRDPRKDATQAVAASATPRRADLLDDPVARRPGGRTSSRLLLVVRDVEEGDADRLLERLQLDLELARSFASRALLASSSRSTAGSSTSARARATCCWPPLESRAVGGGRGRRAGRAPGRRRSSVPSRPWSRVKRSPKPTLSLTVRWVKSA